MRSAYTRLKPPRRLPVEIQTKARELMPNRLNYLKKLFQEFKG